MRTEQADITKQVAAVEPLVGPLKDAAEKTQQAAAAAVEDKELAAVAAQVKVQSDAKTAALAASKTSLADNSAALDTAKKQLADAQKQAVESQKSLDAGKKQVETVTPQLADATPKADAAKKASDAAAQLAAAAVADVAKWNDEIEFDKKRKELTALRTSFQQLAGIADGAKAGSDGANAELAAANANR